MEKIRLVKVADDKRGAIHLVENLLADNKEFTFLEIKKGFARGGCYHDVPENWIVLRGSVRVGTFDTKNDWEHIGGYYSNVGKKEGDSGIFLPGVAHFFEALEDSIIIEYGVTSAEKKDDKKFEPLRTMVNKINNHE